MASVTYNVPLTFLSFVTTGTGSGNSNGLTLGNGSSVQTYTGFNLTYGNVGGVNNVPINGTIQSVSLTVGGILQYTISGLNVNAGAVFNTLIFNGSEALANLLLSGDDSFAGTGGNDTLDGRSGNDSIFAGAGNDILIGGSGNDALYGGIGDDQYLDVGTGDAVVENPGEGTDEIITSVSYVLPANVENLTFTGASNVNGTGNALANVINGSGGDNVLDGGAGADTVHGWAGNDTFVIDDAGDVAIEQPGFGTDTLRSSSLSLSLAGFANIENIELTGGASLDATGDGSANSITGNSGNNRIDGGGGADQMKGGAGSDTYVVDNAGDQVKEWNLPPAARTISIASSGTQGNDQSNQVVLSGDGGKAVFLSLASNFAAGDAPGTYDLFLKDMQSGAVTRVDTDANGTPAALSAASGLAFALTPDARYLVFATASSLSGSDSGGVDVYRKDLQTGAVVLVSRDAGGNTIPHDDSKAIGSLDISDDGRYVAFTMTHDIGPGTLIEKAWVKDLQTGVLTEASTATGGTAANGRSFDVALSGDGHYLAFASFGDNLVLGDQDGTSDIFLKNLQSGATTRVGINQGFAASSPVISSDGRYVAFLLNNQIYYDDTTDGAFPALSGGTGVHFLTMSDDGRFLAFTANEPNFSSAFGQAAFVRDMQNGSATVRLDGVNGQRFSDGNQSVKLSPDGHFIGIATTENVVVPGDANDTYDTFQLLNPLAGPPVSGLVDTGGVDTVEASLSYALGLNLENLKLTGSGNVSGTGNALNNVLTGNGGNNALDGGGGTDTAVYGGLYRTYALTGNPTTSATITGAEGSDTLVSIEALDFMDGVRNSDGSWTIDPSAGSVARLYWGTLGRAPDVPGLLFHMNALDTGQFTLSQDAANFVGSPEFQATYGSLTNTQYVDLLYQNILGRPRDPSETYWLDRVNTGTSRADVALGFTDSPENILKMLPVTEFGVLAFNTMTGTGGDDVLTGRGLIDTITGGAGNDTITGGAQNDTITPGSGNDSVDGGSGFDVAIFTGAFRQYGLTGNPAGTATLGGPEGTDSLAGLEKLVFLDGSLSFNADAHIAQVERLYLATLDRLPDALGLNFHLSRLDTGMSLNSIAGDFVGSPEFQAHYGALSDAQFVEQLYLNVLHRSSDPEGLAFHTGRLAAGDTRGQVVTNFSESPEFVQNNIGLANAGMWDIDEVAGSVARLYLGGEGHGPTVAQLTNDTLALKGGTLSLVQEANNVAASTEFVTTYGSDNNQQFVDHLYLNLLNRPASGAEQTSAIGLLNTGHTRGEVLLSVTDAFDYQFKLIGQIDHGIAASDAHFP